MRNSKYEVNHMAYQNNGKDIYNQLEQVIQKLDKSLEQNEHLKLTIIYK